MNNFWLRALTGSLFVSLIISAILIGGYFFYGLMAIFAAMGQIEFYKLFKTSKYAPNYIGVLFGVMVFSIFFFDRLPVFEIVLGTTFLSVCIISSLELFRKKETPFQNISLTLLGVFYVAFPFFLLILLTEKDGLGYNFRMVLSLFVMIWANDTFAYLIGRFLGKNKLFERISPKKTWEGFIGGVLFSAVTGFLLAYAMELDVTKFSIYGLLIGTLGTLGDLVQSMLKRSLGVKDSGKILPGHGGILDRFDGVIFVTPFIFYLEQFIF